MRLTKWLNGQIHKQNDEQEFDLWEIDVIKKLAAYEDAEEHGLLVRLPCKVGDTVYEVVKKRVDLTGYRMEWGCETVVEAVKFRIGMTDSVGKTVFLSREEAEAALKGE